MKRFLLTPIFKAFKRRTFFSSLEQNNCPVYDAKEIKKHEQKEGIKKSFPLNFKINFKVTFPNTNDKMRAIQAALFSANYKL